MKSGRYKYYTTKIRLRKAMKITSIDKYCLRAHLNIATNPKEFMEGVKHRKHRQ